MLKDLRAPYVLGEEGRKRAYWVKLKPEYEDRMLDTLDLLVVAGYYGEGKNIIIFSVAKYVHCEMKSFT